MTRQLAETLQRLKETRTLEAAMEGNGLPEWVFLTPSWTRWDEGNQRRAFINAWKTPHSAWYGSMNSGIRMLLS